MTTQLQPQTLDIEITKITAKTVYYKLWANGKEEKWVIPESSTFNKSTLVVGVRYNVDSVVILEPKKWDYKTRKYLRKQRFDWVTATPAVPKAKLAARTQQQRKASEAAALMPVVDDGTLFTW